VPAYAASARAGAGAPERLSFATAAANLANELPFIVGQPKLRHLGSVMPAVLATKGDPSIPIRPPIRLSTRQNISAWHS
jgi:hypothetical protein